MKKKRKARFADKVLLILAVTTAIFVAANYISFWRSNIEQSTLITAWFGCVGIELAALISKRIAEQIKPKAEPSDDDEEVVEPTNDGAETETPPSYPRWADFPNNYPFAVDEYFTYYGKLYHVICAFNKQADRQPPALNGDFYEAVM
jgi:hypothetical protein